MGLSEGFKFLRLAEMVVTPGSGQGITDHQPGNACQMRMGIDIHKVLVDMVSMKGFRAGRPILKSKAPEMIFHRPGEKKKGVGLQDGEIDQMVP